MGKGLMIDVIAPHPDEEGSESAESAVDPEGPPPRSDGDAIIASIESQLAQLRSLLQAEG